MYRSFISLVNRFPAPSRRMQIGVTVLVLFSQAMIAVTGSVVRVTASGLGCPTWPKCFPDSFHPTTHPEVASFHQFIEFSNRLLTFVVVAAAALAVIVLTRAHRRTEVLRLAWLMPASTVLQAIIGGITVLTGLAWWTVAIHLLVSMIMVWLAAILLAKVREDDNISTKQVVPQALRWLTGLSAAALSGVLIVGTMLTGAGPHAGDKGATKTVERLDLSITTLAHIHADLTIAYFAMLISLGFALLAVKAPRTLLKRLLITGGIALSQGLIGIIQYATQVPAALVACHVAGATATVTVTAILYSSMKSKIPD